jgi:8-oxo-dGTP pyrophosphatase MutT (NUDIX family)
MVRLRASAVCSAEGRVLLVRMRDPVTKIELLFPPGGAIEAGETPAEAARRETLEETGLRVRVDASTTMIVRYPYPWAGVDYDVTTHYFAAVLDEPFREALPAIADADYNLGAVWMPIDDAARWMAPVIAAAVMVVSRSSA